MKKVLLISLFIFFSLLAYAGFLLSNHNKYVSVNTNNYGEYGIINTVKLNDEEVTYYDQLYLRSDGSFYLSINSYYLDKIIVGTYEVNDNFLTLNQSVLYSNNGCFYKDEIKTFVANIEKDKIILEYNGIKKEFIKGLGVSETSTNKEYYVTSPNPDVSPKGIMNEWKDCSTKLTKK